MPALLGLSSFHTSIFDLKKGIKIWIPNSYHIWLFPQPPFNLEWNRFFFPFTLPFLTWKKCIKIQIPKSYHIWLIPQPPFNFKQNRFFLPLGFHLSFKTKHNPPPIWIKIGFSSPWYLLYTFTLPLLLWKNVSKYGCQNHITYESNL